MRSTLRWVRFAGALAAIGFVCACHSPTGPSLVTLTGLKISGPASGAPGSTLRYTATASYSDGSSRDVTAHTQWIIEGFQWTSVDVGSWVAPRQGDSTIAAAFQETEATGKTVRASDHLDVLILEPGTYRLSEGFNGSAGIIDGSIQAISGNVQGQMATRFNSRYIFYGAKGPIRIEADADGFSLQVHDLVVTSNTTDDFTMVPTTTPVDVSGLWTLTLVRPSSSCPSGLPSAGLGRTYAVRITQQLASLDLDVSSPTVTVIAPYNNEGFIDHTNVILNFQMNLDDFTGGLSPNILDHVTATDTFSFGGRMAGTLDGSAITGALNGTLFYWTGPVPTTTPIWACTATDHVVTMRRADTTARQARRLPFP